MQIHRIDPVRYGFAIHGGPEVSWHVRSIDWQAGLSQTYRIHVELICDGYEPEFTDLLGQTAELTIDRNGMVRAGHGIVNRVEVLGSGADQHLVRVSLVPALELLGQRTDTRIFQGKTVVEILTEVLTPALAAYGRSVDTSGQLAANYEPRDYCVQFRESDLDFCMRLMEEEGIVFFFEDDEGCERLILADNNDGYPDVPLLVDAEIPVIVERASEAETESLQRFDTLGTLQPTTVYARQFNWKLPSTIDEGEASTEDDSKLIREVYIFDADRQIIDDPKGDPRAESFDGGDIPRAATLATRQNESNTWQTFVASGSGNVTGMCPGFRFCLGEHPRAELGHREFLVVRVTHEGRAPEEELGASDGEGPRYANHFECVPVEQVYRSPRWTPKPRVYGPQTATVKGPADDSSEDIHTDIHGRVKVRFHWDRLSPDDGTASCWVRVTQTWAGNGWGSLFIPRVGMEVVVEFLDGDPDRPLITGCVYNGDQSPPYTLPDDKTKSTLKTQSSPGGGGFNELRFEDAKGNEEVFLHAQKDLNETVLNDHTTQVGNNQTITVDVDQSTSVTGNQTIDVTGDQTTSVTGDQSTSVTGDQSTSVTGSQSNSVTGAQSISVTQDRTITVSGMQAATVTGNYSASSSASISLSASTSITLSCGSSTLSMVPGKIILSVGESSILTLDANAALSSTGVATLGAPTAMLSGGGASVQAATGTLTCLGDSTVDLSAGIVNISGSLVRTN